VIDRQTALVLVDEGERGAVDEVGDFEPAGDSLGEGRLPRPQFADESDDDPRLQGTADPLA